MRNVLLYLRKSRDDENESKEETLARHERMLIDYCKRYDLKVEKVYKEVVSGESIAARPEVKKLLDDVAYGSYDGVVVVELERLSRGNQIDQAEILEIFKKSGTKIYTLNKVYDFSSNDEIDEEFFEFGLFMSRREYKVIKRRLLRGRKQAQREGYYTGSVLPFGFTKENDGKGFILKPDANADLVKELFDLYVNQGKGISYLRNFLNASGVKPLKAYDWTGTRVRQILQSRCYIGKIKCDGEWYEGKHKSIVDLNTFEAAQVKLLSKETKTKQSKALKNPFATIARCSVCGSVLKLKRSPKRFAIGCSRAFCSNISMLFEDFEMLVISGLQDELEGYKLELGDLPTTAANKREAIEKERKIYLSEIEKKQSMLDKASEMLEIGVYSVEKYLERENILRKDIDALQANLDALSDTSELDEIDRLENAIPIIEKALDEYWDLSPQAKNDILKSFVDKIIYTKTIANHKHHSGRDDASVEIFLKI